MAYIDKTKPLNRLLLEDDTDDLEFHPPQTRRDGAGSWRRKRRNFAFNEGLEPDPVIDRIRESWDKGDLFHEAGESLFETRAGVGLDDVNGQIDVAKSETLLNQAGVYDLKDLKGPTGIFSYGQQDAIKQYQTDNGLRVDGVIKPGGETMRALKAQLQPRLKAPVTAEPAEPADPIEPVESKKLNNRPEPAEPNQPSKPGRVQLADNSQYSSVVSDAQPNGLLSNTETDPNADGTAKTPSSITLARHYTLPAPLGILNSPTDKNPSKQDLDQTEKRMRDLIADFRKRGWIRAADNLERFVDGSGKVLKLTREEMLAFKIFRNAEAGNRKHFETGAFLAKAKNNEANNETLRNLKDGDEETITDHYIYLIGPVRALPIALSSGPNSYLSFGDTHIRSTATITVRRVGNIVHYSGTITHTLKDPFDFKKGQPGAGDALKLQKYRGAKPFNMEAEWQQEFSGTADFSNGEYSNPKIKWWDIEMQKSK